MDCGIQPQAVQLLGLFGVPRSYIIIYHFLKYRAKPTANFQRIKFYEFFKILKKKASLIIVRA